MINVRLTDAQAEALHALLGDALDDDHEAEGLAPESTLAVRYEDPEFAEKLVSVAAALREAQTARLARRRDLRTGDLDAQEADALNRSEGVRRVSGHGVQE